MRFEKGGGREFESPRSHLGFLGDSISLSALASDLLANAVRFLAVADKDPRSHWIIWYEIAKLIKPENSFYYMKEGGITAGRVIFFLNVFIALMIITAAMLLIRTDFGKASMTFGFVMLATSTMLKLVQKW